MKYSNRKYFKIYFVSYYNNVQINLNNYTTKIIITNKLYIVFIIKQNQIFTFRVFQYVNTLPTKQKHIHLNYIYKLNVNACNNIQIFIRIITFIANIKQNKLQQVLFRKTNLIFYR